MLDIENNTQLINTILICSEFYLTEWKLGNQQNNLKIILQSWFFVHSKALYMLEIFIGLIL